MTSCDLLRSALVDAHWGWFAAAALIDIACGSLWYSVLFPKTWARVFKVDTEGVASAVMMRAFGSMIAATLVFGFALWAVAGLSAWAALGVLVGFCAWEIGNLGFDFGRAEEFLMASLIRAGYTLLSGLIFIVFALF